MFSVQQAQSQALRSARKFQTANGVYLAAKETFSLAELRLMDDKAASLSPAWQEMLNLAVLRVRLGFFISLQVVLAFILIFKYSYLLYYMIQRPEASNKLLTVVRKIIVMIGVQIIIKKTKKVKEVVHFLFIDFNNPYFQHH